MFCALCGCGHNLQGQHAKGTCFCGISWKQAEDCITRCCQSVDCTDQALPVRYCNSTLMDCIQKIMFTPHYCSNRSIQNLGIWGTLGPKFLLNISLRCPSEIASHWLVS